MKLTDRLLSYLERKEISIHYFEIVCGIGNGYFGKQHRGKGSMGSDILEKIAVHYPDLNLNWLVTGRGSMLHKPPRGVKAPEDFMLKEEQAVYAIRNKLVTVLKDQIKTLENALPRGRISQASPASSLQRPKEDRKTESRKVGKSGKALTNPEKINYE